MHIKSLRSKMTPPLDFGTTSRTEKKTLPTNPFQQLALRNPSLTVDSFEAGGRPCSGLGAGVALSGDVFQSATQASGARAALDVLDPKTGEFPPDPPPKTADGRIVPQANDKRPKGDDRSAKEIVDDSPALAHLGRQKDIKFDQLCKQTGVNPDLDVRDAKQDPDAVYRLSKVLEFIDACPDCEGNDRPGKVKDGKGDGNLEGITQSGDARHGTEVGMVKDFAEKGYDFLKSQATLPTTTDTHVTKDGGNKDNFQWGSGEAAKKLFFIPGVSNVLSGIGNSKGGAKGVIEGAVSGAVHTVKDRIEGAIDALGKGRINPILLGLDMYKSELAGGTETPDAVKDLVDKLP